MSHSKKSSPDQHTDSKNSGRQRTPWVRLNSSKVEQLNSETDNLVDISTNSRFAQWRRDYVEQAHLEDADKEGQPADQQSQPQPARTPRSVRRWKGWVYGLATVIAVAALFVGVVFFSPLLATRTITVQGASLLDSSYVKDQLVPLEGVPMTRVTEDQVADLVGNQEVLRGVSLEARPPHELVVKLHERVPVAVVKSDDAYVLVDDEGKQLRTTETVESAGVPLVDGGTDILGTPEFTTVTGVLAALPTSILSQVSEATADSTSTINLQMVDGTQVIWGAPAESELKAKVLTTLMESVGAEGAVTVYDVSSPLVPTVK